MSTARAAWFIAATASIVVGCSGTAQEPRSELTRMAGSNTKPDPEIGSQSLALAPYPTAQPGPQGISPQQMAQGGRFFKDEPNNGLIHHALMAGIELRDWIARNPLRTSSIASFISSSNINTFNDARPLYDNTLKRDVSMGSLTRALMTYIVSCALDPTTSIGDPTLKVENATMWPESKYNPPWKGELGLCQEWASGPPSAECQEIVSACVLARVNAQHKQVLISMRGDSARLRPLSDVVPVQTEYRENDGAPIESFRGCDAQHLSMDEHTNCGWKPLVVGMCTPGDEVTVGAGITSGQQCDGLRGSDDDTILRVCGGLHGCNDEEAAPGTHPYSWHIDANHTWCAGRPAFKFTCPGVEPERPGYFSVMIASRTGNTKTSSNVVIRAVGSNHKAWYPAPEERVFMYREGAFYGNIFDDMTLQELRPRTRIAVTPKRKEMQPPALFGDMFACYSDGWTSGTAYMSDRFCALSPPKDNTGTCFAKNIPMPCFTPRPATPSSTQGRCLTQASLLGDYDDCLPARLNAGTNQRWKHPITVFVNDPCDLAGSTGSCSFRRDAGPTMEFDLAPTMEFDRAPTMEFDRAPTME